MAHLKKGEERSKQQQQVDVLLAYEECGNITEACEQAKVPRRTFYNWLAEKTEDGKEGQFSLLFREASPMAVGVLEDEAKRRAVSGVEEPVFHKGVQVAKVRKYSDTLLIVLLKAHAPEKYKERLSAEHSGPNGMPIQTNSTVLILPSNGREITPAQNDGK